MMMIITLWSVKGPGGGVLFVPFFPLSCLLKASDDHVLFARESCIVFELIRLLLSVGRGVFVNTAHHSGSLTVALPLTNSPPSVTLTKELSLKKNNEGV